MVLNIIFIAVIVLCLGVIIFIYLRKLPRARTLDVKTVPAARRAEVRDRILLERIKRNSEWGKSVVGKGLAPIGKVSKLVVKKLFSKIYDLEEKYKKEAAGQNPLKRSQLKNKMTQLLADAQKSFKDGKYQDAEKAYIEIISLDPKNIEAYEGLNDVYLEIKEYAQALQTAEFILKLISRQSTPLTKQDDKGKSFSTVSNAHERADAYCDLGYIHGLLNQQDQMSDCYFKALELEPNNPRNISLMLEIYIRQGRKSHALDLLADLERVNPDNQRLKEFKDQITAS